MFSSNHRQHLLVVFQHLDSALTNVLMRLGAERGDPLFDVYLDDSKENLREGAAAEIAEIRQELSAFMTAHRLQAPAPHLSAAHAAHAYAATLLVTAAELGAHHLRGYGELSAEESEQLDALSHRLGERLTKLGIVLQNG